MINIISKDDDNFMALIEGDKLVDEFEHFGHKGQTTGDRIYEMPEDYDVPKELHGFWKVNMTWGDMCGQFGYSDAVRVDRKEEVVTVTKVTWPEVHYA